MFELPQFQEQPRERADAARNRERILAAAGTLVDECGGIDGVSMDDVAKRAEVGTGTLYRRFGDRAGLAFALLDEQTKEFQNALISGPPPLGPGVPAAERLHAFGAGFLDLLETHAELMVAAAPTVRESAGVLALYTTHLRDPARGGGAAPGRALHGRVADRDARPGPAPADAHGCSGTRSTSWSADGTSWWRRARQARSLLKARR